MPWKNYSFKEQRWKFVQLALHCKTKIVEQCKLFGISRKTGHKWIRRFQQNGRRGLGNQSRAPRRVHNRPTRSWFTRIRRCRLRHPKWGAAKIYWLLRKRYGAKKVPSEAAIGRWLNQWGLTRRGRKHGRKGPKIFRGKLTQAEKPNDVWTVDFKGWFRTGDGTKVEPLTVRDLASRYILAVCFMSQQNVEQTRREFERIFRERGLPRILRMDNGSPFGSKGALGLTRLSAWWLKLGIGVEFIEPGHPEQNGGHEQVHRMYQADTLEEPAPTLRAQEMRSARWCKEYNQERPHEGLGMKVPADIYRRSRRRMPPRLKTLLYPKDFESRLVRGHGTINLKGRVRFVGEAFEKERIGLKGAREGIYEVYFGRHLIGELWNSDAQGIRAVTYQEKRGA